MADEPILTPTPVTPASTVTPQIAPTPVPVASLAVTEPVQAVTSPPAPAVAPAAVAPVVAPEAPAQTVLGEALDKPVVAPVEVAPVTNTDGSQSAEPAPLPEVKEVPVVAPTYEAFSVPEGITLDQERSAKFTELLSGLELTGKADHAAVQEFGQKAVDFHISEVKRVAEDLTKLYQTTWEKQKTDWKDSVLKDPELGGNRIQTTVDSALTFIRTHGGTEQQQKEFRNLMESSGLGNHPAILRLLANAGRAMSEGKPLAAVKPVQDTKSKTETLYGKRA